MTGLSRELGLRSVPLLALVLGCAGRLAPNEVSQITVGGASELGWRAAVEGRDDAAASLFHASLVQDPHDALALFGDASLAFERGDSARAISSYVTLLERSASAPDGPLFRTLAAMATGRVATLLDENPGSPGDNRAIEDRVLALSLSKLPWQARYDLAVIADRILRRRGDPGTLARAGRAAGCLRAFTIGRPTGNLPHVDLDVPAVGADVVPGPAAARATAKTAGHSDGHGDGQGSGPGRSGGARTVEAGGCVVSIASFDGRPSAERILADIQVPGSGAYDVVLDFQGEARVIVDGGTSFRHGGEYRYGPRVTASRVVLSPGRHQLEFRLASFGGHLSLVALVVPAGSDDVDQSVARHASSPTSAVQDFATSYVANRLGDSERAWAGAERLQTWPRFALGLALAATLAHDDPSRPANFGRDRARTLLTAAVTIDPGLGRARNALAGLALDDDRPREAVDQAKGAMMARPGWWLPELTLHAAYRLRGLEWDADRVLDQAIEHGRGACAVIEAALERAEDRRDLGAEARFSGQLETCGLYSDERIERMRRKGDLGGAESSLRRVMALAPDREDAKLDLASVLLARGKAEEAAKLLAATVGPRDGEGQIRLADALTAAGAGGRAREVIATALALHPDMPEILRAARAMGLPLPLDPFRLDGRQVIREFQQSGHKYAAPAVVVLDRTVTRVFKSGAEMILTHEIVRVQSKDAIEKWGETSVPERAEILVLRTHKADGTTREPEEFAGKDAISAADLAVGDYVEKEIIEVRPPRDAFLSVVAASAKRDKSGASRAVGSASDDVGGFIGDRFYFQSFDAPLDRSEYLVVTDADAADKLRVDLRAGAPAPTRSAPVPGASDGTVVTTFAAARMPQLFAERSSVPAIEHVPSVRVSMRVGWAAWSRFLREQLYGTLRTSPGLRRAADDIRAVAGARLEARAAALVAWVGQNIESGDDLRDPASFGVARGRGNRVAVILALARLLGVDARPVLARSRLTAEDGAPAPIEEADDFADPLVRFEFPGPSVVYVDPRLKHAPFGYLPPGLDGARALVLSTSAAPNAAVFEIARGRGDDHRAIDMDMRLDGQGGGVAEVTEDLRGWPAMEWAEIVDRFGNDPTKLRQDFEQRSLGVHFPGAVLKELNVEIVGSAAGKPAALGAAAASTSTRTSPPRTSGAIVPVVPYTAAEVRLRYSFSSPRLAFKRDREIRFLPTFFRSQPGRRYATEPRRQTMLMTGFDVPLDLRARVELPSDARLVESPSARARARVISRPDGYRFFEERQIQTRAGSAPVLVLRREARLPIMRVPLKDYSSVADELRSVDAIEQEEIRIRIAPDGRPGGAP